MFKLFYLILKNIFLVTQMFLRIFLMKKCLSIYENITTKKSSVKEKSQNTNLDTILKTESKVQLKDTTSANIMQLKNNLLYDTNILDSKLLDLKVRSNDDSHDEKKIFFKNKYVKNVFHFKQNFDLKKQIRVSKNSSNFKLTINSHQKTNPKDYNLNFLNLKHNKNISFKRTIKNCISLIKKQIFLIEQTDTDINQIKQISLNLHLLFITDACSQHRLNIQKLSEKIQTQLYSCPISYDRNFTMTTSLHSKTSKQENQETFFINSESYISHLDSINKNFAIDLPQCKCKTSNISNYTKQKKHVSILSNTHNPKNFQNKQHNTLYTYSTNQPDGLNPSSKTLNQYDILKNLDKTTDKTNKSGQFHIKNFYNNNETNISMLTKKTESENLSKTAIDSKFIIESSNSTSESEYIDTNEEYDELIYNSSRSFYFKKTNPYSNKYFLREKKGIEKNKMFIRYFDFNKAYWNPKNTAKEANCFPEGFSFSPGWRKYHLSDIITYKYYSKNPLLYELCEEYGLNDYAFLIHNIVRSNTFTKKNTKISFVFCYHLVCYHLCSKYNLGKGKKHHVDQKFVYIKSLNHTNYYKLFKTESYWRNKAQILFKAAEIKALKELDITKTSLTVNYLYNYLLLLPFQNSKAIAYICYVHYASINNEINIKIKNLPKEKSMSIIEKRKKIFSITVAYKKYNDIARHAFKTKLETGKIYNSSHI
ncbi:hypothetical protein NUSPORA_01160 [Nucleospora cyclopteri]